MTSKKPVGQPKQAKSKKIAKHTAKVIDDLLANEEPLPELTDEEIQASESVLAPNIQEPTTTKGKKHRPVTESEISQIRMWILSGKTDKWIANTHKRNLKTIRAIRAKLGIKKSGKGTVKNLKDISGNTMHTTADKQNYWRYQLVNSTRYLKLQTRLGETDLQYFVEMWSSYHVDVREMNTAEEDMLEVMICTKLRMDENDRAFKECKEREMELRAQLDALGGELDMETETQRWLYEQTISLNKVAQEINKDYKELGIRYNESQRALNLSREQRENKKQIGADTFLTLIVQLTEAERRDEVGKFTERLKMSAEKRKREMKRPHTFMDGTQEPMLLDGADFVTPVVAQDKKEE